MTQTVTGLKTAKFDEIVEFDHDVLLALCDRHGSDTETVLAAVLGQVEHLLELARLQLASGEMAGLSRTCADLMTLSRVIGMRTLERAADAVQDCLTRGDTTALAACGTRLLRLARPESVSQWTVRRDTVA